jgi:hypothetical protein
MLPPFFASYHRQADQVSEGDRQKFEQEFNEYRQKLEQAKEE